MVINVSTYTGIKALRYYVTVYCLALFLVIMPDETFAQWATATSPETGTTPGNIIAFSENSDGYRLEIYKDISDSIKSRFILKKGLIALSENICPTFQVDNGIARNYSIDNTECLSNENWSEYIIGKIANNQINSSVLIAFMDGITLTFRFRLQNGDYRETHFSLAGSKRSLTEVLGIQVVVNEA